LHRPIEAPIQKQRFVATVEQASIPDGSAAAEPQRPMKTNIQQANKVISFLSAAGLIVFLAALPVAGRAGAKAVYKVAVDKEYAPYEFVDLDGEVKGFTPELLRAVGEAVGVEFKLIPMDWPNALAGLKGGSVDLVNMIRTPQRLDQYEFSEPHSYIKQAVFRNASAHDIAGLDSLTGHLVALQLNDISFEMLAGRTDFTCVPVHGKAEGFLLLNAGRVDAFLASEQAGLHLIEAYNLTNVEPAAVGLFPQDYCFALRKGNRELTALLNSGLKQLEKSGRYNDIVDKWLTHRMPEHSRLMHNWRKAVGLVCALMVVLTGFVVWNFMLRRAVNQRTKALFESRNYLKEAQLIAKIGSWEWDIYSGTLLWSEETFRIFGVEQEEFPLDFEAFIGAIHSSDRQRVRTTIEQAVRNRVSEWTIDYRIVLPGGELRFLHEEARSVFATDGRVVKRFGTVQDVTEQKLLEDSLRSTNRKLRAISDCNQTLMRAQDEQALLEKVCQIVCEEAGYRLAWVGYAEYDENKSIAPRAWAGGDAEYVAKANLSWSEETERGRGAAGIAIRSGETVLIQDFTIDPKMEPWRESALARGYRSGMALPLKDENGIPFGALLVYSSELSAAVSEEIKLMEELAGDLAFGIAIIRARKRRGEAEHDLALHGFALNNVHEAAFLIGEDARFSYVNDEACRVLGYSREELLDLTVADIDPNLPAELWREHWLKLRMLQTLTFEGSYLTKNGAELPVEINSNYFEYNGRAFNLSLVRDISGRKQLERGRLANLKFFESMDRVNRAVRGTNNPEQMMSDVLDATLSILDCDRAYLMYPCDPEAKSWSSPMERTKPEYPGALELGREMPMDAEVAETLRILLEADGPVKFGPGGEYPLPEDVAEQFGFHCFMATALYPKTGKPWQFGIHQCSGPRIWTSLEERIFQEIARRIGDGLTGLLAYRDLQKSEEKLRRLNEELEHRVDERTRQLSRSHADLEEAYKDLKIAQTRILQQEKMASIGQLAAGVAHEINNPLGFIISNMETLKEYIVTLLEFMRAQKAALEKTSTGSPEDEGIFEELETLHDSLAMDFLFKDIKELIDESIDGGERMKRIVWNLKSFARVDEQENKMADLNEGIESTLNIVWNELKYKAEVSKNYGDIPEIYCNPGQLNQVFMNLFVNAAQAIEKQGEIVIETREENGSVIVRVSDTGCGIAPDKLSRIFEPFFTTKPVGKGTGLGLSIAYDIVKKHGGEIKAESEVGRGSSFTVSLPVAMIDPGKGAPHHKHRNREMSTA